MENEKKPKKHGRRKINRKLFRIMAYFFIGAVLLLAAAGIVMPDKKYSEEENRVLTAFPKISMESLKSKSFMNDLEAYTSDQFIFRDAWIGLKVQCDLLLGKRGLNGVYLGKEHYLMQIPVDPDEKNLQENLEAMNQFAAGNPDLKVNAVIVPNAAYILKDYMPKGAPVRDQGKDMEMIKKALGENINCIDVTETLQKHADEGIYYKTDHHWTSKGAVYAFNAAAKQLGIDRAASEYKTYTVTTKFSGTLASKSGYHKVKDTIEVYAPENTEVQYLVSDSDNAEERPTVYDKSALETKDKYQVFFGGNHAKVSIETTLDSQRKLLIIKDSYANCFTPLLIPYYNEIIMIDPRYYYDDLKRLISNEGITDVLFLYNMDTFLNDNSIADVLADTSEE